MLNARGFLLACALVAAAGLSPARAEAPAPVKGTDVVAKLGNRKLTLDELKAELAYEPAPLIERARDDENFARILAVRWFQTGLFAQAAQDDGLLKSKPGLAGAAAGLGRNLIADEYVTNLLEVEYKPTESEVRSYYALNKELCTPPARYHLARLGVQIAKNASEAEVEGAKKRLQAMQERLKAGEPFATVADELSDLPSQAAGGDVGWIDEKVLAGDETAVKIKALKPGETTEPLRTPRGLEVFRLVEKEEAQPKSFESCRDLLTERLTKEFARATTQRRSDELARRYGASLNLDGFLAAVRSVPGRAVDDKRVREAQGGLP